MNKVIDAKVCIMNCPDKEFKTGYLVARLVESVLWYYGTYDTMDKAAEVAVEIGNGVVMGIVRKEPVSVTYEIPREDYNKALENGADSIIGESVKKNHSVRNAKVIETHEKYYLQYETDKP